MVVKRRRWWRRLRIGLLLTVGLFLAMLAWPRENVLLKPIGIDEPLKVRRGLDLAGGVQLVWQAKLDQLEAGSNPDEVVKNAAAAVERRANPGGAGESIVQTAAGGRIIVQIPGATNPKEAIDLIGKIAELKFYEVTGGGDSTATSGQQLIPTPVTGSDIKRVTVDFQQPTGQPVVSFEFKGGQSTEEFATLTARLSQSGAALVALLDDQPVFNPAQVQNAITDGRAQLSGNFTVKRAREITTLLNAGALPVPIELVAQQTVGPTLGDLAVKQSLVAALVGLFAVSIFLLWYYRWAGLMAVFSLIFYTIALLAVIKVSTLTPYVIVLTLAGIAGFILSIAVAVDANILIIERMKEEAKAGHNPVKATMEGFSHAWTSIRDANAATIIGSAILYWFGGPVAVVRAFALTLAVGVAVSLLVAFVVSRTFLLTLARSRWSERLNWLGIKGLKS
ncbi:protein translocase subunit SecD [Candidatus Microgenomates bacterium]|nr:protein translocase subunit SecD [Candidatus Microgenomates bacterium]